jgi:hypothetical protein
VSSKKLTWDLLVGFLVIIMCLFIPLDFAYNRECFLSLDAQSLVRLITYFTYVIFGIDIIVNFFTAIGNEKGEYEYDLRKIAINYLKSTFVLDLFSNLPFEFVIPFSADFCWVPSVSPNKLMLIFKFLRVIKLVKINEIIEKHTPASLVTVVRLAKLLFFYYFIIHTIGIIFTGNSETFLNLLPQEVKDAQTWKAFFQFYSYSIFIGIYLILGSDVAYYSSNEKVLIIVINIISLIVNANIFGYIAVTLKASLGGGEEANLERIESIMEFLNYQDINSKLKNDIKSYYLLMYKRQRDLFYGKNIFGDLSTSLMIISKFEYWKNNYFAYDTLFVSNSSQFLCDSLLVMKAKMFLVNERIIQEGEHSMDFYMLPSGGRCAVKVHGVMMKILNEGEFFGETAIFLTSEKRSASVDSLNLSDMMYIEGRDFLTLLRNHQEEAEFLKSVAMSNFFNTIPLTRITLATQLFPKNTTLPLFKKNLYCNHEVKNDDEG